MSSCVPTTNAAIKRTVEKILCVGTLKCAISQYCCRPRSSSHGTFKPRRSHRNTRESLELCTRATETLGSSNLRAAVKLPNGEDRCEWIAANCELESSLHFVKTPMLSVVDFFNQLNMLYGTLTEVCTDSKCPVMSAGPNFQYYWSDGERMTECQ